MAAGENQPPHNDHKRNSDCNQQETETVTSNATTTNLPESKWLELRDGKHLEMERVGKYDQDRDKSKKASNSDGHSITTYHLDCRTETDAKHRTVHNHHPQYILSDGLVLQLRVVQARTRNRVRTTLITQKTFPVQVNNVWCCWPHGGQNRRTTILHAERSGPQGCADATRPIEPSLSVIEL